MSFFSFDILYINFINFVLAKKIFEKKMDKMKIES
jgi:hypothetical protein